ncbi:uncharacterized protein PRCAT00004082001 [Priceomyces carsonii]|uniref:uncharacterized protein n=1 Tax=Priceomyces carsonii TaxID=28549 RepID=UPI002ED852E6|nr:unnamed protein product [Priceomyces carsonii]
MLRTCHRRFSTGLTLLESSSVKPLFKPHYLNKGARSFDRNLPFQKLDVKPWEKQNISKDEFFMRKYGSISNEERERLNQKVERQRRAREQRKQNENSFNRERTHRNSFREAFTNPLNEYLFGTHSVLAALMANKRHLFSKLFVHNNKEKDIIKWAKKYSLKIVEKDSKGDLNILAKNGTHNGVVLETKPLQLPTVSSLGVSDPSSGDYEVNFYNDLTNTSVGRLKTVARHLDNSPKFPIGLYLDGITDPQNMGAIVRSAYFLGADFIVVPDHDTARLGPVASKASAGALELMDIYQVEDSFDFISQSKKNGWSIISTSSRPNLEELSRLRTKNKKVEQDLNTKFIETSELSSILQLTPTLLIMGNEGEGVRTHLKIKSDFLVGLDNGRANDSNQIVDSLNVSVAAAMILGQCLGSR